MPTGLLTPHSYSRIRRLIVGTQSLTPCAPIPADHRPQRPPHLLTNTADADVNCHESRYSDGRSNEGRFGEGHEGDDYESYAWADDCDDVPAGAAAAAAGAIIAFAVLSSLCCCVPCIVAAVICCCIAQASQRRREQALAAPPAPGGLHYGHPVRPLPGPRSHITP